MALSNTARLAASKSYIKLGNVQMQPRPPAAKAVASKLNTSVSSRVLSSTIKPLNALPPKLSGAARVVQLPARLSVITNSTMRSMADAVVDRARIISSLTPPLAKIVPGYFISPDKLTFTKVPSDSIKQTTKKYTSYENLTGISQDRPEIIMMSTFQPIYHVDNGSTHVNLNADEGFLTPAGRFLDAQVQLRYLRAQNVFKMLNNVKRDETARTQFIERSKKFNDTIIDLSNSANYLLGIIRRLESVKSQLDLRNDIHIISPDELDALHIDNYVGNSANTANLAKYQLQSTISSKFDINDILARFGFEKSNLINYYASTKLWLQLMYEFKQICISHSLQMIDANIAMYTNDTSPAVLVKPTTARFVINPSAEIFDINTLVSIQPEQVDIVVNSLDKIYRALYVSSQLKTVDIKISALTWTLSREYRFSHGLDQTAVSNVLNTYYKYSVKETGNQPMLDALIGQFGNDIGDVSSTTTNSLVDIAQSKPDENTDVLTFEEKYITGDNGTLTPGGVYYVDSALKVTQAAFQTNKLNDLTVRFENAYKNFSVVANGLNIFMKTNPTVNGSYSSYLSNPRSLYADIASQVIDFNTGKVLKSAASDKLSSLIVAAASPTGQKIKAALFALIMCRLHRTYGNTAIWSGSRIVDTTLLNSADNTATTDKIIEDVLDALDDSVKPSVSSLVKYLASAGSFTGRPFDQQVFKSPDVSFNESTLRASLKSGSYLLNAIKSLMGKILATMHSDAFSSGKTKFGGYTDTIAMMVAFDLIINVFARYSNQTIVGKVVFFGTPIYTLDITDLSFTSSVNDIEGRLNTEMQFSQQCGYAVMNTLKRLSDSMRGTVNYIESPQSLASIGAVVKVLNDEFLIDVLMNQQQLMMLASTVTDLRAQVQSLTAEAKSQTSDQAMVDIDSDTDFDYEDEIKLLDDGIISPKTKLAIQGFLSDPEFATSKAINKKIITVGIPMGFTEKLKQRVTISKSLRSSFTDKQSDIVNLCVYKVDLQHPDIIYSPRKYPFEISRFPVRNDDAHPTFSTSMTTYVGKFPTRDYTQAFETNGTANDVQYLTPDKNATQAFADDSYSFLTSDQKASLAYNHTVSFLLETYTRLMTGITLNEQSFNLLETNKLVDEVFAATLVALQLEDTNNKAEQLALSIKAASQGMASKKVGVYHVATIPATKQRSVPAPKGAKLSASARVIRPLPVAGMKSPSDFSYTKLSVSKSVITHTTSATVAYDPVKKVVPLPPPKQQATVTTELAKIRDRSLPLIIQQFATIDEFTRMLSPLADSLQVSRKLLSPKQFDRIFSVIVDPDDFEIDYSKTMLTPQGREAIDQLISTGDVVQISESDLAVQRNSGITTDSSVTRVSTDSRFKFRDRDRTSGDAVFEKYFIVVETLGVEVV